MGDLGLVPWLISFAIFFCFSILENFGPSRLQTRVFPGRLSSGRRAGAPVGHRIGKMAIVAPGQKEQSASRSSHLARSRPSSLAPAVVPDGKMLPVLQ